MSMMLRWRIWLTARASATNRDTISGSAEYCAVEHLDRGQLADQRVGGAEDRAEAALADLLLDEVLADLLSWLEIAVVGTDGFHLGART